MTGIDVDARRINGRGPWNQRPFQPIVPYEPPKPEDVAKMLDALNNAKPPTREEFNALKAELESLKKLLAAAKQYDTETGQPDCEDADKIALFRQLAKLCGVSIGDVFPVVSDENAVRPNATAPAV